jgi:hypothetical protein
MQISRHWRLNAQRYRLEGFRNANGEVSLQPRRAIRPTNERLTEARAEETRQPADALTA